MAEADSTRDLSASRRGMLATGALLASMLAVVNSSLVNAVPLAIANHLAAEPAQAPWILNAFYAPLAGLLLVAGAAGDRLGRTRLLLAGAAAMAAGALVAGLADGVAVFVTGRAIQGVGAALLMPNSLATLTELFSGPERARMVGLWSAGAAAASSAGPAIGGWLSETGYWRWIFLASLPAAAVVSALVAVGEHSAGGEMAREPQPDASAWIPLTRLASTAFVGLSVFTFLLYGVFFSLMVLLPHLLSHVIGWSASAAGASLLPVSFASIVLSPWMANAAARLGPWRILAASPLAIAAAMLLAFRIVPGATFIANVLPVALLIGAGISAAGAPLTLALLGTVDVSHAGAAGGFNSSVSRMGGLLATALIGPALTLSGAAGLCAIHIILAAQIMVVAVAACVMLLLLNRSMCLATQRTTSTNGFSLQHHPQG
jgi:predicted MFS family arabinose efflux permease